MSVLAPRSLFGRNVLLIFALIVLAELAGALLFQALIQKPRAEQLAMIAIRNMNFLRTILSAVPDAERAVLIAKFNQEAGIEIATEPPQIFVTRPLFDAATRSFANRVAEQLHEPADALRWQLEQGGSLWVPLQVDRNHRYWIGIHNLLMNAGRGWLWLSMSLPIAGLALLGAYRIQRRINRPLNDLVVAAHRVANGEMPTPLPEAGPNEIVSVSHSFNHMMQSLRQAEKDRAFMLAGVSHDLRTPLTKLRLGVEIMREKADTALAASMECSINEMDAIIEQFIDFARTSNEQGACDAVDMNQLIRDCADACLQRGVTVQLELSDLPALRLQRRSIERALTNLMENALSYGAPPIIIHTQTAEGFVNLSVSDCGVALSEAELNNIKQPFVRGSAARSGKPGAGLGLAIVERIAGAHGGELILRAREGGGLEAILRLPTSP